MPQKIIKLYAPEIDFFVSGIGEMNQCGRTNGITTANKIKKTLELIQMVVKPKIEFNDRIWQFWLKVPRGDIEQYGNFAEFKKEGVVNTPREFIKLWREEYPDKIKWYQVILVLYENNLYISFDNKLRFSFNLKTGETEKICLDTVEAKQFFKWLLFNIEKEVLQFKENPEKYNLKISKNLPFKKRFGKIKRLVLWRSLGKGYYRIDQELGKNNAEQFKKIYKNFKKRALIAKMTAREFYKYCEICYDANNYFSGVEQKLLSPKEKYLKMADGRDGGLRDIDQNSEKAFSQWYKNGGCAGGHPWEICRGGNSTHISLYAVRENKGWQIILAGSSHARVVETAKMAIALFKNKIPFVLRHKEEILRMITGIDYVGIVPEDIIPTYCHDLFPEKDKIHDFLNPWFDLKVSKVVAEQAEWYPPEKLEFKK